jgi:hypothetical protein
MTCFPIVILATCFAFFRTPLRIELEIVEAAFISIADPAIVGERHLSLARGQ